MLTIQEVKHVTYRTPHRFIFVVEKLWQLLSTDIRR